MTKMINNPILRGFNPDPNILQVGDNFYIVTSTFEWFPGYQIHHSKDLVNWRLLTRPLDRVSQLDMKGVPDSCGVWAPCLSYDNGIFYLIYTNVKSFDGQWKDMPNYLVTATNIEGPWSEPIYLNSSGFDASMFHDDDGKSYVVNMLMDHRNNRFFGGIVLQEYDKAEQSLTGDIHYIFEGTEHGRTEGPHIYKRNGYYYLLTAEGGTSYEHCMTLARSRNLTGPYEVHPENPFITAKYHPENPLQKTGHGDLLELPNGDWYAVFLTGRPLTNNEIQRGRCILGRESAIEQVEWRDDGWLYTKHGSPAARLQVPAPDLPEHTFPASEIRTTFNEEKPDIHFQSLRVPMDESWVSTTARPGYLRLTGRESLSSTHEQSMIARRVQAHNSTASTCLEFQPDNFQQMAGLVCYYNTVHYHYLHIGGDDFGSKSGRRYISIVSCDNFETSEPAGRIELPECEKVWLKANFNGAELQFFYATKEHDWQAIGPVLDGSILSDDYVENSEVRFHPCFTGAFYGLACQDLSGQKRHADFAWFDYEEL